jgi:putative ABC transport system permease protein
LAVRTALGASRARVIRQLLIESLLLSCIGAAIGLLFASAIVRALIAIAPTNLPESTPIGLNLPVLLFTTVLAVITAVLFGLAPAIHTTRSDVSGALKERSSTGGRESSHTRSALIIVETALALVLSVGAGLLLKSFIHLTDQDPGFATHGVLTMGLSFDPAQSKLPQMTLLMREIGDRLRALPGIEAAGGTSALPMDYGGDLIFTIEGKPAPTDLATAPDGLFRFVTPGYLQALGLKLQQGRWMAETDQATSQPVVIINRALATKYFPGQNALGQHLSLGAPFVPALRDIGQREIIGIVGDARTVSLHEPDRPTFYMPVSQMPLAFEQPLIAGGFNLAVRTAGDPLAQKTAILSSIHSVAPAVPISDVRTIQDLLGDDLSPQRFNFLLLLSFAGIGVLLAAVGIYGVMA